MNWKGIFAVCVVLTVVLVAGFSFAEKQDARDVGGSSTHKAGAGNYEKVLPVALETPAVKVLAAEAKEREGNILNPDWDGMPDLVVDVEAPEEVNLGREFSVTLITRNTGNASAINSTTVANFTICENPTYCTAYGQRFAGVPPLDSGEEHKFSISFYCYQTGYYNITGIADYENNVTESNESNNQNNVIVNCVPGLPDLVVFMLQNFRAYVGDTTPMSVLTYNEGYGDAPESITSLNFQDIADWIVSFRQPPFHGLGGNTNSFNYRCRAPGNFSALATADAANQVNESNEENNEKTADIQCLRRDGTLPDLTSEIIVSNSTLFVGDSFEVVLLTSNKGKGGAGDFISSYTFEISTSGGGAGSGSSIREPPLAPGQYNNWRLGGGVCSQPSEYRYWAQTDTYNNVRETNESNNVAKEIQVNCLDRIPPDLVTRFLYAYANGSYYYAVNNTITIPTGVDFLFYEETSNVGNGTALSSITRVDTPQDSFELPKRILAPNALDVDSFAYKCSAPGTHQVYAVADYYDRVPESNETNNKRILTVDCT